MATTLIDTRKSILSQIHTSWNEWRNTDEARESFPSSIPFSTEFGKENTPWTTKQSVLERNAVHANKVIRLYIALNIDVTNRMSIWQFFEIQNGVVGKIKEQIKLLKRIQKVLKLEQQLDGVQIKPSATALFTHTDKYSLLEIEKTIKAFGTDSKKQVKKQAKKLAKEKAKAIKNAKKIALKAYKQVANIRAKAIKKTEKAKAKAIAKVAEKRKKLLAKIDAKYPRIVFDREGCSIEYIKKILTEIPSIIAADRELDRKTKNEEKERAKKATKAEKLAAAKVEKAEKAKDKEQNKLGKKLAKKTIALLNWARDNGFNKDDIVNEFVYQNQCLLERGCSDNMVTIIDIEA